jgi:RimJ/RimL family protein N-acetyltransferase
MNVPPATDRLIFREWTVADLPTLHAICADPVVMQFVGDTGPWSLRKTNQWLKHTIDIGKSSGFCQWALVLKETSALIGFCGFVPVNDGAEIGWRLAQDAWRRGLATEAARAALRYGFDALGLQRVTAIVQAPNRASIRVCEKLGLTFERSFQRNGREVNVYAIGRNESAG